MAARGATAAITVNNGPELAGKAPAAWAYRHGVVLGFITPGKLVENAYVESFDGKFRNERLNQHWSLTLADGRFHVERYRRDYNEVRSHSTLNNRTTAESVREHDATKPSPDPTRLSRGVT